MRFHYNNIRAIPLLMKYVFILLKWKSHDGVRGRDVCLCTCTTAQCEQSAYKCACAFVYVCEMLARRIPKIVANGRGAPPPPPLPIAFHFNHFSINFEFEHFHVCCTTVDAYEFISLFFSHWNRTNAATDKKKLHMKLCARTRYWWGRKNTCEIIKLFLFCFECFFMLDKIKLLSKKQSAIILPLPLILRNPDGSLNVFS